MERVGMNAVFDAYAAYYDLLYRDKDYAAEARYVDALIQRFCHGATDILELGCGTGSHARRLAEYGYAITGIDRSEAMIRRAMQNKPTVTPSLLEFSLADLRTFRSNRDFDVVLALFHVMSYQTSNDDLAAAIATVAAHLRPGGLFVFDCWYGPGVLTDPPVVRERRLHGDGIEVIRNATPKHYPNENRVNVEYKVQVRRNDEVATLEETHPMRYLFAPEVDLLLEAQGLRRVALQAWMDEAPPDLHTWNACFIACR
jgi:SAM-dependent methyltransferase